MKIYKINDALYGFNKNFCLCSFLHFMLLRLLFLGKHSLRMQNDGAEMCELLLHIIRKTPIIE